MKNHDRGLRIKNIIDYKGMTQKQFAEETGIDQGNISKIINGKIACEDGVLNKILLAYTNINPQWLRDGQGEMFKNHTTISGDITITGNHNSHIGHVQMPTIIEVKDSSIEVECPNCGETIEVPDTAVIPLIPAEVAKKPDLNLEKWRHNYPQEMQEVDLRQIWGNGVFLMRVDTRAMEPEYREGTFLVLRKLPDISYARADGSAYVVDTMRPHTLFRYLSKERDGSYTLTAENDRRGPIYLKAEDILNVYDIVGSFRIGR